MATRVQICTQVCIENKYPSHAQHKAMAPNCKTYLSMTKILPHALRNAGC